jgi:predicted RNA-binding protein YlqC (UPF0109 family)
MTNNQNSEIKDPETISTDSEGLVLEESELLLELVRSIVKRPEKVSVDVVRAKETTLLTLTVDPEDRGHVIGRNHRTLTSICHLFSKAAFLEGRKVVIQLDGQNFRSDYHHYQSNDNGGDYRNSGGGDYRNSGGGGGGDYRSRKPFHPIREYRSRRST